MVHPGMALVWLFGAGLLPLLHHQHGPEDFFNALVTIEYDFANNFEGHH